MEHIPKKMKSAFLSLLFISIFFYVNSIYRVKAESNLPLQEYILTHAESFLIDDMDSEWTAIYGSLTYNFGEAGLTGIPRSDGSEKLRLEKTLTEPVDLHGCNIGFDLKTTNIPSDLSIYLEVYDIHGKMCRWGSYHKGINLLGSNDWTHHIYSSAGYYYMTSDIDMSEIYKIILKFYSAYSDWTFSIDDLRAYPNEPLYPNGAVLIALDGPYPGVENWLEPKCDEYGYKATVATARRNYPDEEDLIRLYNKGWVICVYARMYDNSYPPKILPTIEFTENTIGELSYLHSLGIIEGANNIHCNRHISDVESQDLLDDEFFFVKGSSFTSSNKVAFPFTAFYGGSTSPEIDKKNIKKASDGGYMYILFNHLDGGSYSAAYTQEDVNDVIDLIHSLGMEVVTPKDIYERIIEYYGTPPPPPPPPPSGNLIVNLDGEGYHITENGVIMHFETYSDVLAYLEIRFRIWENLY